MLRARRAGQTRVFEVVKPPDGTTRYVDQVVAFPDPGVSFVFVSIARFVLLDYDVVHLHWPEMVVRHRIPFVERLKCALFDAWVRVLRWRKIAIVWTLHNVEPHDATSKVVRRTLDKLRVATDLFIRINQTTHVEGASTYIPHAHYRDRFEKFPKPGRELGRLLYAGLIRPYKGIEQLLTVFSGIDDPTLTLRIVGKPTSELREVVLSAVASMPKRTSARLEFVSDEEFVEEICRAEIVCLPYKELHNSGILLVALSLHRPVLVPDTVATRALAEEVGPGWVMRFSGELDGDDIQRALHAVRETRRAPKPNFQHRDWEQVGRQYSEAFRSSMGRAGSR